MWKYDVRWMIDDIEPSLLTEVQQVCEEYVVKANVHYRNGKIVGHYNKKYSGKTDQTVYAGVLCNDLDQIRINVQFFTKNTYSQLIARCVVKWQRVTDQVPF